MKKLTAYQLLSLNAYWVGLSFMWNGLHGIVLPAVIANIVPSGQQNTMLGLLTSIGLAIAVIVQPLSGALSDGWRSRWGRRRPLITLGTLFDVLFLVMLGYAGRVSTGSTQGLIWLFIGYLGLQLSSNIAHGPAQGLMPDVVPAEQLPQASGWKIFIDMGSAAIAVVVTGILLGSKAEYAELVMWLTVAVLFVMTAITIFGTKEKSSRRESGVQRLRSLPADPQSRETLESLLSSFRIDFRANLPYWWLIAQRFVFLLGIYGIQAFAQNYLRDVLVVSDPPRDTGILLGIVMVALIGSAMFGSWLIHKIGMRRTLILASVVAALGSALLWFARSQATLFLFGSVLGAGVGVFLTANWTLANRLAPPDEAGKYLGLTNLATAGAGVAARLSGAGIDFFNNADPGAWMGYMWLFFFGGFFALASIALIGKIEHKG
jgi:Na+/melibiose symporter-like transporter